MATFSYEAREKGGSGKKKGIIEAEARWSAITLLERQGLFPVKVEQVDGDSEIEARGIPAIDRTPSSWIGKVLTAALDWRDLTADFVDKHRAVLRRVLPALAMVAALAQAFSAFPIGSAGLMVMFGLVLVGVTTLHVRCGVILALIAMLLAVAFHSPLAGWLFGFAVVGILIVYLTSSAGSAIVVVLTPLFLRHGLGAVIPLTAGLFLRPGRAVGLGIGSALVGLCYMAAGGLSRLGPLGSAKPWEVPLWPTWASWVVSSW